MAFSRTEGALAPKGLRLQVSDYECETKTAPQKYRQKCQHELFSLEVHEPQEYDEQHTASNKCYGQRSHSVIKVQQGLMVNLWSFLHGGTLIDAVEEGTCARIPELTRNGASVGEWVIFGEGDLVCSSINLAQPRSDVQAVKHEKKSAKARSKQEENEVPANREEAEERSYLFWEICQKL